MRRRIPIALWFLRTPSHEKDIAHTEEEEAVIASTRLVCFIIIFAVLLFFVVPLTTILLGQVDLMNVFLALLALCVLVGIRLSRWMIERLIRIRARALVNKRSKQYKAELGERIGNLEKEAENLRRRIDENEAEIRRIRSSAGLK